MISRWPNSFHHEVFLVFETVVLMGGNISFISGLSTGECQECAGVSGKDEWHGTILSSVQYQVTRGHATERAWAGKYNEDTCVCCRAELFSTKTKFDSGSGWPSFFDTQKTETGDNITRKTDNSLWMTRTEVLYYHYKGQRGHVFDDGLRPTGLRYIAALNFEEKKE